VKNIKSDTKIKNMSNLSIYQFKEQEVRVKTLNNEPWFLGADVCRVLEIKNYSDTYSRLKIYEKTIGNAEGISNPDAVWISESGLYRLILTSRKPQAEAFQDWVVQEVLPTIRKTGSYGQVFDPASLSRLDILTLALESEQAHVAEKKARELAERKVEVLKENVKELRTTLIEKEPLVQLAETLVIHDVDTVNIPEFAKAMKIGRNKMFEKLRKINFIQKDGRTPYQKHINAGRAEVYRKPRTHQQGVYDTVTVLTAKGQEYVCKKLKELERMDQVEVYMEGQLTADDF
jgi:anti-repressor protein